MYEHKVIVNLASECCQGRSTGMIRGATAPGGFEQVSNWRVSRMVTPQDIERSLELVQHWVESRHYRGYEPSDGLSSWARPLAFGNILAQRLLQQLIRQCPFNLRPLF